MRIINRYVLRDDLILKLSGRCYVMCAMHNTAEGIAYVYIIEDTSYEARLYFQFKIKTTGTDVTDIEKENYTYISTYYDSYGIERHVFYRCYVADGDARHRS